MPPSVPFSFTRRCVHSTSSSRTSSYKILCANCGCVGCDRPPQLNICPTCSTYKQWYSPNGARCNDDFELGYNVCVLGLGGLTNNLLSRPQSGNGSCFKAFDQDCVSGLPQQIQRYALELVSDPAPSVDSNFTDTSLPTVCNDIATSLRSNWPQQCFYLFNKTGPTIS